MGTTKGMAFEPTFDRYPDMGCGGLCVRSLNCPFTVCVLDDRPQVQTEEKNLRRQAVLDSR